MIAKLIEIGSKVNIKRQTGLVAAVFVVQHLCDANNNFR